MNDKNRIVIKPLADDDFTSSATHTKEQFDEWIGLFHRLIDLYDILCEQQKKNDEHFDNMIALCKGQTYSNGELIDILNNILDEREDI